MSKQKLIEEFRGIVKGIDKDEIESDCGWWETSTGADFGKQKIDELESFISSSFDRIQAETREKLKEEVMKCMPDSFIKPEWNTYEFGHNACRLEVKNSLEALFKNK